VDGFLNLNKPVGFTSHDCVAKIRRLLKLKRVGHAGTLDPAASGVLPIAIGRATRLLQFLPGDKAYHATIRFGVQTTTDDLEGDVLQSQAATHLTLEAIQPALPQFLGPLEQIPPAYSAIQVQGKRLYDLARAGQTVEVKPRAVEVFAINVLAWQPGEFPELKAAIACGSGTYIRAIARDLGQILAVGGTLAKLIRTRSSGFDLRDSLTFETLATQVEEHRFQLMAPEQVLSHLPTLVLPNAIARRWCQGQKVSHNFTSETLEPQCIYSEAGTFLGIGSQVDGLLYPQVVFVDPGEIEI